MSKSVQLLFCVEADNKSQTDAKYIQAILTRFYPIHSTHTKINDIYMCGKTNFEGRYVVTQIEAIKSRFKKTGNTHVIYIVDTDRIDSNPVEKQFLERMEAYCRLHDYHLITFCPTIEEVLLKRTIPNVEKVETANRFLMNAQIDKVSETTLRSKSLTASRKSNILNIIDDLHVF